jgi:DUF4097 and DUF4098 domain-containing protein YvlB
MIDEKQVSPARRSRWVLAGGLVAVLVLLGGGILLWIILAGKFNHHAESQNQTYSQPVSRVEFDLNHGGVEASPGQANEVKLERKLDWQSDDKPVITEQWQGDVLRIHVRCANGTPECSVNYRLTVPSDTAISVLTGAGDLVVRDLTSDLKLDTKAGKVTASGVRSPTADTRTSAGDVDLTFAAAPGSIVANSSAGNVTVTVPQSDVYQVDARSGAGSTDVNLRQEASSDRKIVAHTSAGNVKVGYAA